MRKMLGLFIAFACVFLTHASYVTKVASEITVYDVELLPNEHLNIHGMKKLVKGNVEHIILKNCSGVIDQKTFHAFPKLTRLTIYGSNIKEISSTLPIHRLMVMGSHFPNLDRGLQQKLSKLQNLLMLGNKAFLVDTTILREFKKLTGLYLSEANFTDDCITKEWFKGMERLKELGLSDNGINCITHDAFNSLKNLEVLDLSFNHIPDLEKVVFKKLTKLEKLGLYENNMDYIDLDVFSNQKRHLKVLGISWQALKNSRVSAESLLRALPKLQTVSFGHTEMPNDFKAGQFCQILRQSHVDCDIDSVFGISNILGYTKQNCN